MSESSAKDKKALVIDLVKKGHTTRMIVKMAHVSNPAVKKTKQKITKNANEDDQKKKPLSVSSQAFRLFLEVELLRVGKCIGHSCVIIRYACNV